MRPFHHLDSVTTEEGRELTLHRRDQDFFINLDGEELMSTRAPGSEIALAELGCEDLGSARRPRVLIGGLGLGYTLRAALAVLPKQAQVVVAELFPAVVEWHRTHLASLAEGSLEDPRVRIEVQDVWDVLSTSGAFDAILLDVDNGPDGWCLDANSRLYHEGGLERIRKSLSEKGTLALWASQPDPRYVQRLRKRGFQVRTQNVRTEGQGGNRRHVVILARQGRPGQGRPVQGRRTSGRGASRRRRGRAS